MPWPCGSSPRKEAETSKTRCLNVSWKEFVTQKNIRNSRWNTLSLSHTHTHTHTLSLSLSLSHTHTHTHTHTRMYTHTHTCTQKVLLTQHGLEANSTHNEVTKLNLTITVAVAHHQGLQGAVAQPETWTKNSGAHKKFGYWHWLTKRKREWVGVSACIQNTFPHVVLYVLVGWVLLYVHRNCRLIRGWSPGRPLDFHTAPELWLYVYMCAKG